MVRVDMNPARQAISKRRLRRRRIAARRLARLKRTQQHEILAAEAARQARCAAVRKWAEAEKQRERDLAHTPPKQPSRKPVVRFSADLMVTKIPHDVAQQLPEPVSSPMPAPASVDARSDTGPPSRPAKFVTVAEDWSDEGSDDDGADPEYVPFHDENSVESQVQRRIQPVRLLTGVGDQPDVALDGVTNLSGQQHDDDQVELAGTKDDDECNDGWKQKPRDSPDKSACEKGHHIRVGNGKGTSPQKAAKSDGGVKRSRIQGSGSSTSGNNATSAAVYQSGNNSDVSIGSPESPKKKRKLSQQNRGSPSNLLPGTDGSSVLKNYNLSSMGHLAHASDASLANGTNSSSRSDSTTNRADEEDEIDDMFDGLVKQRAAKKAARAPKLEKDGVKAEDEAMGKGGSAKRGKDVGPRYTEDGLRIVTYDEIAAEQPKGLNGPCPFDCSCCF